MEKKHLIIIVSLILGAVLVFGLVLELVDPQPEQPPVQPGQTQGTENTAVPTEPTAGTTEPVLTEPPTTAPTQPTQTVPATEPVSTTAPTEPECVHNYTKTVTEPTAQAGGYTTYTCSLCGHSYRDGFTAALTLRQVVNGAKLNPTPTGIDELDMEVSMLLARVVDEDDELYDQLKAVYDDQRNVLRQHTVQVDPLKALEFAGDKVFASANEMIIAYEAHQIIQDSQGLPDHFAALFMVITRSMGLESYVVSGEYQGRSHVWNAIKLDGELYYVDTCRENGGAFLVPQKETSDYVCTDADDAMATQPGFTSAQPLEVTLKLTDSSGTVTKTFTWSAADSGSEASTFMCCEETVKCQGEVSYTVAVSGGTSVALTGEDGTLHMKTSLSGKLSAGSDAELVAEDLNSLMSIRIQIDN